MTKINPAYLIDAYKIDHRRMYPEGMEYMYSNFTPRKTRIKGVDKVVFFGLQSFLQTVLGDMFDAWFQEDEDVVCAEYERRTLNVLGPTGEGVGTDHIRALHRKGYLPLRFKALPEGTEVPLQVPMFTVENTEPEFFWLTNYIESVLSAEVWLPSTSATLALRLRRSLDQWAEKTSDSPMAVDFQGHDFSFRGLSSLESGGKSGAGHLLSFAGTDSMIALDYIEDSYDAPRDGTFGGMSVPATEHSVMCAGTEDGEIDTFKRLLDIYPAGILSVVSDTWSLWEVVTEFLPVLKENILARDGKLVIRPDSGNPTDILTGEILAADRTEGDEVSPEGKGVVELLWETFGGVVNSKGYKELDPHIGVIYGDAINYERAQEICARLEAKGFASTNVVFGVGSYAYQYNTRDTFGFAMKATWVQIDEEGRNIFKDPITDDGHKRSAKGRLAVVDDGEGLTLINEATQEDENRSLLETVWENGKFVKRQQWTDIVERVGVRNI